VSQGVGSGGLAVLHFVYFRLFSCLTILPLLAVLAVQDFLPIFAVALVADVLCYLRTRRLTDGKRLNFQRIFAEKRFSPRQGYAAWPFVSIITLVLSWSAHQLVPIVCYLGKCNLTKTMAFFHLPVLSFGQLAATLDVWILLLVIIYLGLRSHKTVIGLALRMQSGAKPLSPFPVMLPLCLAVVVPSFAWLWRSYAHPIAQASLLPNPGISPESYWMLAVAWVNFYAILALTAAYGWVYGEWERSPIRS
jgi:hypothetical protein